MKHLLVFTHPDVARHAHLLRCTLDLPRTESALPADGQALTLGGWALSLRADLPHPNILLSVDDAPWEACTRVERADVNTRLAALTGSTPSPAPLLGFFQEVQARHTVRIATQLDKRLVTLFVVVLSHAGYQDIYSEYLQQQLSAGAETPTPIQLPLDGKPFAEHLGHYTQSLRVVQEHELLAGRLLLPEPLAQRVDDYRLYIRTHQNLRDLVAHSDAPQLKHPLSGKPSRAVNGGQFHWHSFWLRFTDGTDSFYVIQKVSAMDAVFIPSEGLLLKLQHVDDLDVKLLTHTLLTELNKQAQEKFKGKFVGFNVGHPRPAHLLQDVLPGLAVLEEMQALKPTIPLCTFPGGDYIEPSECFTPLSPAQKMASALQPGEFMCLMGAPMTYSTPGQFPPAFYQRLNERLINMARHREADWPVRALLARKQHFVLWLGISAQKRVWVNQVDGLVRLIERFQAHYPNLLVAFDGWTNPKTPLPSDLAETQRDRGVMIEVLNRLHVRPAHVDLIGQGISRKIAVAEQVNFYFTSALTGSVWVSRAFQKKGMLHISKPLRDIAIHHQANPNALLLPAALVSEVDADKAPRFDYINYSIDLDALLAAVQAFTPEFNWPTP